MSLIINEPVMGGFQQKSDEVVSIGLTSKACINSEIMSALLFSFLYAHIFSGHVLLFKNNAFNKY